MKRMLALILALVMALGLTACGGDKQTESKGESGGYVQGVTDDEILVYNSAAISGAMATTGGPINVGIKAYFDYVNANGGIGGRKITFLHTDDEYDPVKGLAAFEKYAVDEKVFALVGMFGSGVTQACLDRIKEVGIPAVYFATGIKELYNENGDTPENGAAVFPVQPIYVTEGRLMVASAVKEFGAKKIGVIYTSDDTGMQLLDGINIQAKEAGVAVEAVQVAVQADDVSAAVTSIVTAGCDYVVIAAAQATFPTIAKELAAQGNTAPAITTYINGVRTMAELCVENINGQYDLYCTGWLDATGENEENLKILAEYVDEEYVYNGYTWCGWIAGHVFCEGLRRVGDGELTWESYVNAMEDGAIKNPFGGNLNYADNKRLGTTDMYILLADLNEATGWKSTFTIALGE